MRLADFQRRWRALCNQFAVAGEARQPVFCDQSRDHTRELRTHWPRAAHIHVNAGVGGGDLNVERLIGRLEYFGDGPGRFDRAIEARREDWAPVDGDDLMRPGRGEADFENILLASARME